jgi:hypothetical protein
MTNKQYRIRKLLSPGDGCSLVADNSKGLRLGALAGLEQIADKTLRIFKFRRISRLQG